MNNHCHIFNMVYRVFHVLIFPSFTLFFLEVQLLISYDEHVFEGLELHGWIHWHYDFT
jgi:hypothetical protein